MFRQIGLSEGKMVEGYYCMGSVLEDMVASFEFFNQLQSQIFKIINLDILTFGAT